MLRFRREEDMPDTLLENNLSKPLRLHIQYNAVQQNETTENARLLWQAWKVRVQYLRYQYLQLVEKADKTSFLKLCIYNPPLSVPQNIKAHGDSKLEKRRKTL